MHLINAHDAMIALVIRRKPAMIDDVIIISNIEDAVVARAGADVWITTEDQLGGPAEGAEWVVGFDVFDGVGRVSPAVYTILAIVNVVTICRDERKQKGFSQLTRQHYTKSNKSPFSSASTGPPHTPSPASPL